MSLPVVVIVGRPNVGKSTLFNRIIGRGTAIVEDIAGVTRDRNLQSAEWEGRRFIVVDTGGFYSEAETDIGRQVKEQALFAIEEADIIVHLMDAESGLLPDDIELDRLIRESGKTTIKAVNKIDGPKKEIKLYDFFTLGDDIQPLSAKTGYGFEDFMEGLLKLLPKRFEPTPFEEALPRVSVIGRPNVGKSTLINTSPHVRVHSCPFVEELGARVA
jgi:GTP-binding protein